MTHTAEPMTLAQVRDEADELLGLHGVLTTKILVRWFGAIDAELAKQREAEPVAYGHWAEGLPEGTRLMEYDGQPQISRMPSEFYHVPLYTHPQQRNAVEVTGGMVHKAIDAWNEYGGHAITHAGSFGRMRAALETTLSAVASRDREDAERYHHLAKIVRWEDERDMGPGGRYWISIMVDKGKPTFQEAVDAARRENKL